MNRRTLVGLALKAESSRAHAADPNEAGPPDQARASLASEGWDALVRARARGEKVLGAPDEGPGEQAPNGRAPASDVIGVGLVRLVDERPSSERSPS